MTFDDLAQRCYDRLGEDADDPQRYHATLIQTLLREAIEQWSIYVGGDVATQTIALVADQLEYTLTDSWVYVVSVIDDTSDIPLQPVHWQELYDTEGLGANRRWRNVRSTRPTLYTLFSWDKIWLWPPRSSVTDETVTVTYSRAVDDDINNQTTDIPTVPPEYQDLLVDYVVGRLQMISSRGEKLQRAAGFVKRWFDGMETIRDNRRQRGNYFVRSQGSLG